MSDLPIYIVLTTMLTVFGFLLSAGVIWTLLHRHRSPTSTFAWLLAILLLPYVGIPLFLMLGGRKLDRIIQSKLIIGDPDREHIKDIEESGILLPSSVSGVFPTVACVSLELVTDSVKAYNRFIEIIRSAETSIDVCTYILGNDTAGKGILEALTERAQAGVKVRLLIDSYGSMSLHSKVLAPFREAGGEAIFFMPIIKFPFQRRLNLRNHRKSFVIDENVMMVGGMNLASEYMGPENRPDYWDDVCVIVKGTIAQHVKSVFESDWNFALGREVKPETAEISSDCDQCDGEMQLIVSGPDVNGDPIHDSILVALFGARKRIWIVSPYILPDELLLKSMRLTAQRGVDVRLITPEKSNHPVADFAREGYLTELENAGVRVYFHQGSMLHGKAIIVDEDLSFIGSANLDMRSMFFNFETAGVIRSRAFTTEVETWIERLIAESREGVREKNRLQQAWYGLGRLVAPVL